ncbi:hypothetical protein GCM10010911_19630 [Paenibacillus nasutitermitis]|uniref:CYTH domain-containing protein n=1 Tax=Paenibacillus nasutitermitis TaxID=1652958 RepID=A0A917DRI2_9BACL|nr:hypothetical protein GCM10010911_19630 [Paenibacillus nasutitermitis]
MVYVYSRVDDDFNVNYDFYEVSDEKIIPIFTSIYKEPLLIRKRREVWELNNQLFHLDSVEGVGDVFEIEVIRNDNHASDVHYEQSGTIKLFENFLSSQIQGSNEDLITPKE